MKDQQSQKLASMLLDYLRTTSQSVLPPNLVKDLKVAASHEDKSNSVVVTTAIEIDDSDKKMISAYISRKTSGEPKIEYKTNPDLIAGFTLRIGDELIDASVSRKLESLKEHLAKN